MPLILTLIAAYLLVNAVSFLAYYHDKRSAKHSVWRTPEKTLLALAFFGPFGAFVAMHVFRHKTQKPKFRLVPLFLVLHVALAVLFGVGVLWIPLS